MGTPKLKDDETDDETDEETDEEVDEETEEEEVETEEEETADEEEEEVETEDVELPEDEEEDDDTTTSGFLSGSTFGMSNKVLLGLGITAVLIVVVLSNVESQSSTRQYDSTEEVDEEIDAGTDGAVEDDVMDAGGSKGRFDEREQDAAIESVFD